jgi:hypothetical protein
MDAASTLEGIQLDETAGGSMEIEWAKGVTSGGGGDECGPPGEW